MPQKILSPLHKATRQLQLHLDRWLGRQGISSLDAPHLVTYLNKYGPCPIGEVGRVFGYRKSTLSSTLDRLEKRRLLTRQNNPGDRRSFLVGLTPRGRQLARRVNRLLEGFESEVIARLNSQDLAGFQNVMTGIASVSGIEVRPGSEANGRKARRSPPPGEENS